QLPSGEEICGKQVLYQAERLRGVDLAAEELETYLPAIYGKLQPLSKEELIQRFVALEFNRFLNYYRNAPEVRDMSVDAPRGKRSDDRGDRSDFVRLFINLGHMDGIKPQNIIGLLNDYVKDRDMRVGRIDLRKTCSFVEIPASYAELAVQALGGAVYRDRKVFAEVAKSKERGERPERGERSERPEREERAERPARKGRSERQERTGRTERKARSERAPKKDWMAFIDGSAWDKPEADRTAKPQGKAKAQKAWNKDAWGENPWESGAWRSEDRGRGAKKGGARRAQKAVEKARSARKGKGKKK
ncbi:MAG: DbpA RNA binding domain-containing protein, partial [Bacteroidales bacterium]|nr:DbpA RNA binding domain-containing protein [Bacteroidales bacterium]